MLLSGITGNVEAVDITNYFLMYYNVGDVMKEWNIVL